MPPVEYFTYRLVLVGWNVRSMDCSLIFSNEGISSLKLTEATLSSSVMRVLPQSITVKKEQS